MKSKNEHILILTPGFPIDEADFICIPPLQEFLLKFRTVYPSAKISVITFQYPYHKNQYLWNGIKINPLGGKNKTHKKPILWLRAIKRAKEINLLDRVDVIHSLWLGECAMIGNILAQKFNCRHICTLMGQDVKPVNRYLDRLKNSKIIFVALSKNQADQFLKLTNRNVDNIIHWGIDDQPKSNYKRDIDLLAVGSLIPLKNYSLFVRLVEEMVKENPDIICKSVGTGSEYLILKTMAKEKRIEKNIKFTGLLSRTEIFKLMQRSKIFVHPSKFEGLGFVFAEALVNGMNIISFNVGCAQRHPKWFIASDENDFISIARGLLKNKLDYNAINLFPLKETLNRYALLYDISAN